MMAQGGRASGFICPVMARFDRVLTDASRPFRAIVLVLYYYCKEQYIRVHNLRKIRRAVWGRAAGEAGTGRGPVVISRLRE